MKSKMYWGHVMDGLGQLKGLGYRARCCITSPPYFGLRDYEVPSVPWPDGTVEPLGLELTPELYIKHLVRIFDLLRGLLTDDGTLWIVIGDSYAGSGGPGSQYNDSKKGQFKKFTNPNRRINNVKPKDLIGIPWMLGLALRADGWYLRQDIIWNKKNHRPEPVNDRCTRAHEYILLLSKSKQYFYDVDAIRTPQKYDWGNRNYDAESTFKARKYSLRKPGSTKPYHESFNPIGANEKSVWRFPTTGFTGAHYAVFPKPLAMRCILAGSMIQDFVLDPFMGSGTTAEAAELLGRRWIGCELDRRNEELIKRRLKNVPRKRQYELFRMPARVRRR